MNPINEHGNTVNVYPHHLVFLCPRQINNSTPTRIKKWLAFIDDSLDGKMDDVDYTNALFQQILDNIRKRSIDPALLSEIKDEAAWEKAKVRFMHEGREQGREEGERLKALAMAKWLRPC